MRAGARVGWRRTTSRDTYRQKQPKTVDQRTATATPSVRPADKMRPQHTDARRAPARGRKPQRAAHGQIRRPADASAISRARAEKRVIPQRAGGIAGNGGMLDRPGSRRRVAAYEEYGEDRRVRKRWPRARRAGRRADDRPPNSAQNTAAPIALPISARRRSRGAAASSHENAPAQVVNELTTPWKRRAENRPEAVRPARTTAREAQSPRARRSTPVSDEPRRGAPPADRRSARGRVRGTRIPARSFGDNPN